MKTKKLNDHIKFRLYTTQSLVIDFIDYDSENNLLQITGKSGKTVNLFNVRKDEAMEYFYGKSLQDFEEGFGTGFLDKFQSFNIYL